jgi:hypothetical protein
MQFSSSSRIVTRYLEHWNRHYSSLPHLIRHGGSTGLHLICTWKAFDFFYVWMNKPSATSEFSIYPLNDPNIWLAFLTKLCFWDLRRGSWLSLSLRSSASVRNGQCLVNWLIDIQFYFFFFWRRLLSREVERGNVFMMIWVGKGNSSIRFSIRFYDS